MLYAESDHASEALETIYEAIDVSGKETPAHYDWYVFGRVAEECGELQEAIKNYQKVTKEEKQLQGTSTFTLAQKRLAALSRKK